MTPINANIAPDCETIRVHINTSFSMEVHTHAGLPRFKIQDILATGPVKKRKEKKKNNPNFKMIYQFAY